MNIGKALSKEDLSFLCFLFINNQKRYILRVQFMQNTLLSGTSVTVVVRKEKKEKRIGAPIEYLWRFTVYQVL